MNVIGGLIGGLVAGAIGAAVWAGIGMSGYELGLVAWGIGLIVGIGVAAGTKGGGFIPAVIAVVITAASILGGKYLSVRLQVNKQLEEFRGTDEELRANVTEAFANDDVVLSYLADSVVEEKTDAGENIDWPVGADPEEAAEEADYPVEIWSDASERWEGMSSEEQEAFRKGAVESEIVEVTAMFEELREDASGSAFKDSFTPWDALWALLGLGTAIKVAGGSQEES